jgi:hypothetical protein
VGPAPLASDATGDGAQDYNWVSGRNDAGFFQIVGPNNLGGDQGAFSTPYILDPQGTSEMLVGTCRVWRISTSGTAPLQLSNDFDTLGTGACTGGEINLVNALAAGGPKDANNNSTVVYAVTNGYGPLSGMPGGEVWVTTNAGVTLMTDVTQVVNPNGYAISSVAMDKSDATGKTAYVGIMGFSTPSYPTSHVGKTANAGTSWTDLLGAWIDGRDFLRRVAGGGGGGTPNFAILATPTPNSTLVNQNVTWGGALTASNGYCGGVELAWSWRVRRDLRQRARVCQRP